MRSECSASHNRLLRQTRGSYYVYNPQTLEREKVDATSWLPAISGWDSVGSGRTRGCEVSASKVDLSFSLSSTFPIRPGKGLDRRTKLSSLQTFCPLMFYIICTLPSILYLVFGSINDIGGHQYPSAPTGSSYTRGNAYRREYRLYTELLAC